MNKKLILSLGMSVLALVALASCRSVKHDHTYDGFSHDSNQHWQVCTVDGCDEEQGRENHHGGTATCTELAKCEVCDVSYGSTAAHSFTVEKVDDKYLASAADCESAAVYYKSCVCGEKGTETFTSGEAAGHIYGEWTTKTEATCTDKEVEHRVCTVTGCDAEETRDGDAALDHDMEIKYNATQHWEECKREGCNESTAKEDHKGGVATQTEKAICSVCQQAYGELADHEHTFTKQIENEAYLASEATCEDDATYYYACTKDGCTAKGTTTWSKEGSALGHAKAEELDWKSDTEDHWKECSCGEIIVEKEAHTGGTATCVAAKVCEICKKSYGEVDSNNHDYGEWSEIQLDGTRTRTCANDSTHVDTDEDVFGTETAPLTVSQISEIISNFGDTSQSTVNGWVKGYVISAKYTPYNGNDQWEYTIVDSLDDTTKQFVLYGCYTGEVYEGDFVVATGKLKRYYATYEFNYGNTCEVITHNEYSISSEVEYEEGVTANVTVNVASTAKSGDTVTFTVTGYDGYDLTVTLNGSETLTESEGIFSFEATYQNEIKVVVSKIVEGVEKTTVSVIIADYADENNWSNGTKYPTVVMDDNVTVTATGTDDNTGKYYTSGEEWRTYQTGKPEIKITVKEGYKLESVKITYNVSNSGVLTLNDDNLASDDNIASGTIVKVSEKTSEIVFGVSQTQATEKANGQVKITAIEVVYATSSSETPVECEHTNTKLVANEGTKTHNEVCEDCTETVAENVACTTTESATCTEDAVCSCGNIVVASTGHNTEKVEWTPKDGDETKHVQLCATCSEIVNEEVHEIKEATCTEDGVCKCGYTVATKTGHDESGNWLDSEDNISHYKVCVTCNDKILEEAHFGGTAGSDTQANCEKCGIAYGPKGDHVHNYNEESANAKFLKDEATCTEDAKYWVSCSCGQSWSNEEFFTATGTKTGHTEETIPEVAATCTTVGYTAGTKCSVCKEILEEPQEIPALGHAKAEELDWKSDTEDHWKECSCGEIIVEKEAHTGGTATCAAAKVCEICKKSYGEVDSNNHDYGEWSQIQLDGTRTRTCTYNANHTDSEFVFGTVDSPKSVADSHKLIDAIGGETATADTYIVGYVKSMGTFNSQFNDYDNNIYIVDDLNAENPKTIALYRAKNPDGITESVVNVGDKIVVCGIYSKYNTSYQLVSGSKIISVEHVDYSISSSLVDGEGNPITDETIASVTTIPSTAKSGDTVSFTVTIKDGYDLVVKLNGVEILTTEGTTFNFVVSNVNVIEIVVAELGSITSFSDVLKYTAGTTTNMNGNDQAELLNLDTNIFDAIGNAGNSSNNIGLNSANNIRLYAGYGDTHNLTVSVIGGYKIDSIVFDMNQSTPTVLVNESEVTPVDGVYTINARTFIVVNRQTTQVRINSITINYSISEACAHDWETIDWSYDEENHWKKCLDCQEIYLKGEHVEGTPATTESPAICGTCKTTYGEKLGLSQPTIIESLDGTKISAKHSSYTDVWNYDDWKISGAANNNGAWAYFKFGGKDTNITKWSDIHARTNIAITEQVSKVTVEVMSINDADAISSIKLTVASNSTFTSIVDTVSLSLAGAKIYEFVPSNGSSWAANMYYKVEFVVTIANVGTSNGLISVKKIDIYNYVSSGTQEPSCEHTNTKLVANEGTKTHNEVCEDCTETVAENVACTTTESATCTEDAVCSCGNIVVASTGHNTEKVEWTPKDGDETKHVKLCATCSEIVNEEVHEIKEATCTEDGVCKCGYTVATKTGHQLDENGLCENCDYCEASTEEGLVKAVAEGGTVTLVDDIELTSALTINEDTIINLNDHTLTLANTSNYALVVKNGDLTISGEGEVVITGEYGISTSYYSTSTLTINGGTYVGKAYTLAAFGGDIVINGGNFLADGVVINNFAPYYGLNAKVYVNGGSFGVTSENYPWTSTEFISLDKEGNDVTSEAIIVDEEKVHIHTWTKSDITNATCKENGSQTLSCQCELVTTGIIYSTGEEHDVEGVEWTPKDGDETKHVQLCATCGEIANEDVHETKEATCTENAVCVCGVTIEEATGHNTEKVEWTPKDGDETKHVKLCATCGEIVNEDVHETKEATCTENAVCVCGVTIEEATGHDEQEVAAVEPTCTEEGSTAGVKCSVCDEILTAPTAIDALEHDWAETWSSDASSHWHECEREGCEETDGAVAHTYSYDYQLGTKTCSVCSYSSNLTTSTYALMGDLSDWSSGKTMYNSTTSNIIRIDVNITKTGSYEFKIRSGGTNGIWYGNSGAINNTTWNGATGGWSMSTTAGNCKLNATMTGVYIFEFNTSTKSVFVTGPNSLFLTGSMNSWGDSNAMTYEGAGIFTTVIYLEAGTYEYKTKFNGSWDNSFPETNKTLTVLNAGNYKFTANASSKTVTAIAL